MGELVLVGLLQPNKWNPNVMGDVEYQALKRDMEVSGPTGIDPVLVSPWVCFYPGTDVNESLVIVDGEHRWRSAKELNWKEILCEVREITEDDAKAICYRRNRERGNIDPFKEAALFSSELDQKRSQKQIADKYLVDPSTVSHRLSLLRIPPKILDTIRKLPRGTITPSHLEPIASLEPEDQKKFELKAYYGSDGFKSVKQIETEVARIKQMRAEEKALAVGIKTAKFPKCPKCKKEPIRIHYKKLPWVSCARGHDWSMTTGKGLYDEQRIQQNKLDGKPEIRVSSVLRSAHTVKDLGQVFGERIKELVPKMTQLTDVRISGMLEGDHFSCDLNVYAHTMSVYVNHGGSYSNGQSFRAEEHDYRSGEKSSVHCGTPENIKKVEKFIEDAFQGKVGIKPRKKKMEVSAQC